ncbi:hypothetical protein GCM10028803_24230 [Larkinella knui]|uniref:Uncharacterized protein n=1 Tax=Larkinella knui TaxID=2025310 RepID=A0A3P1CWM4_9BACT|nr:DUF5694 domain-containing protein [Larkinella knui]RRB17486.1 hypothetical protein EHT87_04140 [Larkinella knui]
MKIVLALLRTLLAILIYLSCVPSFGQDSPAKIKVYLLGTFHFGATSDPGKTPFPDLFSAKRQNELDQIAGHISSANVSKIFVEYNYTRQSLLDSLGKLFVKGELKDSARARNEIYQIAYRCVRKNPRIAVVATDRQTDLPAYKLEDYENTHAEGSYGGEFFKTPYLFRKPQKKLRESTLKDYYLQINSKYNRQLSQSDFLHYALMYGDKSDFTGEEFTLSWYDRNLRIFTNILRNLNPATDPAIVVLYGSSHTAILRQFFENHARFEIVELESLFTP